MNSYNFSFSLSTELTSYLYKLSFGCLLNLCVEDTRVPDDPRQSETVKSSIVWLLLAEEITYGFRVRILGAQFS